VVRKPLGEVLKEIERATQLRIVFDEALHEDSADVTDELVSFEVRDVDLDGLLKAVLEPVGLQHRREANVIRIVAPERR
jgi:hypothetical protein